MSALPGDDGSGLPVEIPDDIVERVSALCRSLPEVTVRTDKSNTPERSTAYSFDIRKRSFCLLVSVRSSTGSSAPLLVVRTDPDEREGLVASGFPFFTPRAGGDRIGVWLHAGTDWEEVRELVIESYRRLAPKKLSTMLDEPS